MSVFEKWPKTAPGYGAFQSLQRELERGGWESPNTYSKNFAYAGKFPAVYLFTLVDKYDYESGFVAYVGMTRSLSSRWAGHPILRELARYDDYVKRWFMRCDVADLRGFEAECIKRFDPPWNVQGRQRGVRVHG